MISFPAGPGGGSKPLTQIDPKIGSAWEELVAPETQGDPMSPLRWTLKSTSQLSRELTDRDHPVSARKAALLKDADYSLQGNRKMREGGNHIDRNAHLDIGAVSQRSSNSNVHSSVISISV